MVLGISWGNRMGIGNWSRRNEVAWTASGFGDAVDFVMDADGIDLLDYIDNLQGRDRLRDRYTLEELRAEVLRQCSIDWLNSAHPNYRDRLKRLQDQ
jgi:hypothetical protein